MQQVLEHVLVLVMVALYHIVLLTFRRERGMQSLPSSLLLGLFHNVSLRQMNVDYAICQALNYNSIGIKEALIAYDVACQWSIHFQDRVKESPSLSIPAGMSYIPGVGKFHLGAHEKTCFALHSLNFILGAGQLDGEILETLWSILNKAAGSIRAMTKPHRQEVLDDLMRDSNWKKLVNIG